MTEYLAGKLYDLDLEEMHIVNPPVWEEHFLRGKNWCCRLIPSPQAPGGVLREWLDRGRGPFRYNASTVLPGDCLEFGADYITTTNRRIPRRWYGFVEFFTEDAMHVKYFPSVDLLFEYAREEGELPVDRETLLARRERLLVELTRIDALLEES